MEAKAIGEHNVPWRASSLSALAMDSSADHRIRRLRPHPLGQADIPHNGSLIPADHPRPRRNSNGLHRAFRWKMAPARPKEGAHQQSHRNGHWPCCTHDHPHENKASASMPASVHVVNDQARLQVQQQDQLPPANQSPGATNWGQAEHPAGGGQWPDHDRRRKRRSRCRAVARHQASTKPAPAWPWVPCWPESDHRNLWTWIGELP